MLQPTSSPTPPAITTDRILLASNSPRRRELLAMIVPQFDIAPARAIDEIYPADLPAAEVAPYLSRLKAGAYSDMLVPHETIITADTVVIAPDGSLLGKPRDRREAVGMLRSLSDATHSVVTGVTLTSARRTVTFADTTEVTFAALSDSEIEAYVDRYHPFDKAGAYGIQEWIGCIGIERINGCFYNVMGLPLHALYRRLRELSVRQQ